MFSYSQLVNAQSLEQVEEELLKFLQDLGIQTTDWKPGSPELSMLKLQAEIYWSSLQLHRQNARLAINSLSSGSALTYLADSHFNNQRVSAQYTEGKMIVTGSANVVPKTFQATEFVVTDGTYNFYNTEQFTISNAVPYVTATFRAEATGAEYNIPANASLTTVGTQLGFTVTNPPYAFSTVSGSWITQLGSDEESDETLRQRNAYKYASFQTGDLTIDRVKLIALSASSDLKYVSVDDNNPFGPYTAIVYVSTDTTTVPSGSLAAVQTILNSAFFGNSNGQRVVASAATPIVFNRPISIYYSKTARPADVVAAVEDAANSWVASIPIGGKDYSPNPIGNNIAHVNDLVTALNNIEGVEYVSIVSSSVDIQLNTYEKLISPTDWNSIITYTALNLI